MKPLAPAALAATLAAMALAGCATAPPPSSCPAGQEQLRTAQLFFGRDVGGKSSVSDADFAKFVDQELTPRFPDGLTILDGGDQWRGAENRMIREATKVVLIVMPKGRSAMPKIEAASDAYKARFHQEAVLLITPSACVSL